MRISTTEVGLPSENPGCIPGRVIDTDRPCPKCGYNVRGIAVGRPCPECGRPIFFGLQSHPDYSLADAPYSYIRLMQAAMWGLFLAAFGAGASYALREVLLDQLPLAMGGAAALWFVSLAILCIPRPHDREEGTALPQIEVWKTGATLGSQFLWVGAAALAALGGQWPWAGDVAGWLVIAATAGLIPTMMLLADVAEFAGDPDRRQRLMQTAIVLIFFMALAALGVQLRVSVPLPSVSAIVAGVPLVPIILVVVGIISLWNLFQLAVIGSWTIQVARRKDERIENLRDRFRNDRRRGALAHDNEPFGGPVQAPINSMAGLRPSKKT